jgi:hypothetical protein
MKKIISMLFMLLMVLKSNAQEIPQTGILKSFEIWKAEQIKKGKYVTGKDCNTELASKYLDKHQEADAITGVLGIPMDRLNIEFGFINNDETLDAVIFFQPNQCAGGNGIIGVIHKVLVLSEKENKYKVDDTFFKIVEKQDSLSDDGTHNLESVNLQYGLKYDGSDVGKIVAFYGERSSRDGHCCYSFSRKVVIDFKTKKVISNKMLYAKTEEEAKAVEMIFAMKKEGLTIKQIAKIVQKTETEVTEIIEKTEEEFGNK